MVIGDAFNIVYNFTVCDSCKKLHEGDCPTHGPCIKIENSLLKLVSVKMQVYDVLCIIT